MILPTVHPSLDPLFQLHIKVLHAGHELITPESKLWVLAQLDALMKNPTMPAKFLSTEELAEYQAYVSKTRYKEGSKS